MHSCLQLRALSQVVSVVHDDPSPWQSALLIHTQEYNREAPAPSPRMTRAQRRKSLAVDQSMALEPGLARSLLDRSLAAEEEEEEREGAAGRGQAQQQQVQQAAAAGQAQQQKRGAAGRRKSVAATQQVGWEPGSKGHACFVQPSVQPEHQDSRLGPPSLLQVQVALPAERPAQHARHASVADEVAALNAEMCAALSGLVGEESPEKGHRCAGACCLQAVLYNTCGSAAGGMCHKHNILRCYTSTDPMCFHCSPCCRGDQRPLREKLLESWDGKSECLSWNAWLPSSFVCLPDRLLVTMTESALPSLCAAYYERLLAMQDAEQEEQQADKQQAASSAKQQQRGAAGVHAGKHAARTPGAKAAVAGKMPAAAAQPPSQPAGAAQAAATTQPARATPSPLQVALAGSSAVAAAKAALMTPNSQRRKLNELTESLQLLKVSTRQSRAAAAIQAAHQQRGSTPAPDSAAPAPPPAAASGVVGSRSVSPEPPAPAASDHASTEPAAVPKTAGKRSGRRGTSPPTEASAAPAPTAPPAVLPQASATPAGQGGVSQAEMGAVQQRLDAAVADNASLAEQLRQAQAELAAERAARAAEQQELEQLRAKRKVSGDARAVGMFISIACCMGEWSAPRQRMALHTKHPCISHAMPPCRRRPRH